MSTIYISPLAGNPLVSKLTELGYCICHTVSAPQLHPAIAAHPDMLMCKMGAMPESPVVFADTSLLSHSYPCDARYNALCLDKYFVHRQDITAPELSAKALSMKLRLVNVRQGYAKCSSVAVDGNSIITADKGIASALEKLPDLHVLRIRPGYVKLPGFDMGFIGGASGRIGSEIWFNGDITAHPDWSGIRSFIEERGLGIQSFDYELEDVGSLIECR